MPSGVRHSLPFRTLLWPQIILHDNSGFTLPIALNQMIGLQEQQQCGMLMPGTLLTALPVIGLFLLLQKEFEAGFTAGAVKG